MPTNMLREQTGARASGGLARATLRGSPALLMADARALFNTACFASSRKKGWERVALLADWEGREVLVLPEASVDLLVVIENLIVRKVAVNDDRVVHGPGGGHADVQHVARLEDVGLVRHT